MRNGTDRDRRAESGMMRAGCSRSSAAQLMCNNSCMTARSAQHEGEVGWFTSPQQVNQRRYEALRAYFVDGLSYAQAGAQLGYTRWAMINLVREHRAGKLELSAPPRKPGPAPGTAPAKDRARGRVIELRRQGLSSYEISRRLTAEDTPLNRTSAAEILAGEGSGRLLRRPEPEASISPVTPGRDTNWPAAAVIDFSTWPARLDSTRAGLLLAVPDLVSLDLPALAAAAGYPGTRIIPAISWLLSLLALKLTRTRRVSHVDDLLADPAAALFAGLAVLPRKSALTGYSYRLSHAHQQNFLAALDRQMIAGGLATSGEAVSGLDFHAVMHWGRDPALEKHYVPTRSQRARPVLTLFAQDTGTHNLVYANADLSKATQAREVIAFCDHWKAVTGKDPTMLIMDQKVTTQEVPGELDERGVKFLTRRMTIEQRLAEIIRAFCADALSSTVNLNVDLDVVLAVLAQALTAALRTRLPGYATVTPGTIQRRFLETPGHIITTPQAVTVRLERRAFSPVLRSADLPPATPVPWWGGRSIRYEFA